MNALCLVGLNKTAFSVASLTDESDEKQYWLSKSSYERLCALELMRQIIYGYDPSTERLHRVLEVVERRSSQINAVSSGKSL